MIKHVHICMLRELLFYSAALSRVGPLTPGGISGLAQPTAICKEAESFKANGAWLMGSCASPGKLHPVSGTRYG